MLLAVHTEIFDRNVKNNVHRLFSERKKNDLVTSTLPCHIDMVYRNFMSVLQNRNRI